MGAEDELKRKDDARSLSQLLAEIERVRETGSLSDDQLREIVGRYMSLPLSEFERDLNVRRTNDVRARASYSRNRLYAMVTDQARAQRRSQVQRLLANVP